MMRTTQVSPITERADSDFDAFMSDAAPRLRRALVARFGTQLGREATVDVLAYAWQNWSRIRRLSNPVGYLHTAACRAAARSARRSRAALALVSEQADESAESQRLFDPRLPAALSSLSDKQRAAVLLVHGWHYPLQEAAATLGVSISTLRTHATRGLERLRREMEVDDAANA